MGLWVNDHVNNGHLCNNELKWREEVWGEKRPHRSVPHFIWKKVSFSGANNGCSWWVGPTRYIFNVWTPSSGLQSLVLLIGPKDINMHLSGLRTHCRHQASHQSSDHQFVIEDWHKLLLLHQQQSGTDRVHEGVIIQVPGQKLHDTFIAVSPQLGRSHPKKKTCFKRTAEDSLRLECFTQCHYHCWSDYSRRLSADCQHLIQILLGSLYLLRLPTRWDSLLYANLIVWPWIELLQCITQAWKKCGVKGHGGSLLFSLLLQPGLRTSPCGCMCRGDSYTWSWGSSRLYCPYPATFLPPWPPYLRRSDLHYKQEAVFGEWNTGVVLLLSVNETEPVFRDCRRAGT